MKMRTNRIIQIAALLCCIVFMASCEYEFIEVYTPEPPDPTDTIYFQAEITPIFVNSGCTNCHNGGIAFDLTASNAYNSIMANNLAIPGDPDNSLIYTFPHPQTGTHATKYSSLDDVNLIYGWISQGALNN
jgi:hypothetical protein